MIKKSKQKCGYLIAPCTRGLRKNRANCEVTSSRSLALSTKASTFVEHLTVRIATNRMPWNLIFALSETNSGSTCDESILKNLKKNDRRSPGKKLHTSIHR